MSINIESALKRAIELDSSIKASYDWAIERGADDITAWKHVVVDQFENQRIVTNQMLEFGKEIMSLKEELKSYRHLPETDIRSIEE